MAFCFVFTMFFFRSLKFNELMHRPLGRAAFVVYAPFALAGARAHSTLAWSLAKVVMQGFDSAFRVWRILGGGKIRQTLCVLFLAFVQPSVS